ncbi:hypothetical protein, partial [Mesorhizobium sp. M1E.F.Ca.ET.063.01.1.1]|uniref:hypothetical protein n=1 Tax=Mesorhizobium sp. M1E.F.Ca.ET.063.01.1.1 TaxID=2496750 RepID=UPI0024793D0F
MPKSVKRFSGDIMLYLFALGPDSDFRSIRPEIIRLQICFDAIPDGKPLRTFPGIALGVGVSDEDIEQNKGSGAGADDHAEALLD